MDISEQMQAVAAVDAQLNARWFKEKGEPTLFRMKLLMDMLGNPQHSFAAIQIAGTNGKTSVARMVDALARSLQLRVGRTTSPHLQSVLERIAIDGSPVAPDVYVDAYEQLSPYLYMVDEQLMSQGLVGLNKFEVITAMAFNIFAETPVELGVIEVGLGGRYDATNVVNANVAVINPIAIDHENVLGSEITEIAREKVGIIKKLPQKLLPEDQIVIVGRQEQSVWPVIIDEVEKTGAILARLDHEFSVISRRVAVGGQVVTLKGLGGVYEDIFLPLSGKHQADNAAVALAAIEAFFGAGPEKTLPDKVIREAFSTITSPGRLERVAASPTVLVDAAHNSQGAHALVHTLKNEFSFTLVVGVVAMTEDKDAEDFLRLLEPAFDRIIVSTHNNPRAYPVDDLYTLALRFFGAERTYRADDIPSAITEAVDQVNAHSKTGGGVVITGSVVTAGIARAVFDLEPA